METIEVIQGKLDLISEYQSQKDVLNLQKQEFIDSVLTPEIKAKIADIEAEFAGKGSAADENIAALTAEVKNMVIEAGSSIKAKNLQAVYAKGRVSWDPKSLDGYAIGHPEILNFRKEGEPSVSIRKA
jgi:hypothetical protein